MQQTGQVLSVLVNLKDTAEGFTKELQQNLAGVDGAELQQIASAVYIPFESQITRSASGVRAVSPSPPLLSPLPHNSISYWVLMWV